MKTHTHTHL